MKRLFYGIKESLIGRYVYLRYHKKPKRIYFDNLLKCYVHPGLPCYERGSLEYMLSEITKSGLFYRYKTQEDKERWNHGHTFEEVLIAAYGDPIGFEIDEKEYSKQQIEFINTVLRRSSEELKNMQ